MTGNPALGNFVSFSYTMIPLTNNMTATPAIPFSYFDPELKAYVDLTIPALPIKVAAGLATAEAQAFAQAAAASTNDHKLKLSELAQSPGRAATSLVPLQRQSGFLWAQLGPVLGFAGLWYWDRRRRFFELHPEILVRRRAKRALRRERAILDKAARTGDAARFANAAISALRVASAPHFPATPRALVGRDVLELFDEAARHRRKGDQGGRTTDQTLHLLSPNPFNASLGRIRPHPNWSSLPEAPRSSAVFSMID